MNAKTRYSAIRRSLIVTLAVDGSNVVVLSLITLTVREPAAIAVVIGYLIVGLVGFGLAARAVLLFEKITPSAETLMLAGAVARRLVVTGLLINTIFCALLLLLRPTGVSPAVGVYLLIGGDVLSAIYLARIAALKSFVRDRLR